MKENFVIIHWWWCKINSDENLDESIRNRKPWLYEQLKEKWFEVSNPSFPRSWFINYQDWVNIIEKINIDKNTVIIWHSFGVAFAVRWLWETNIKIKKLVCICGTKFINEKKLLDTQLGDCIKNMQDIYDFEINPILKENIWEKIYFIWSEEKERTIRSMRLYQEKLGWWKWIEVPWKSHFTKWIDWTVEFPELLKELTCQ